MVAEAPTTCRALEEVRAAIELEDRIALRRIRVGIATRCAALAMMLGYMFWLSGAVQRLDAPELTRFAAAHLESRLPEYRAQLRDYAIEQAPEITDRARDLLLAMPAHVRRRLEERLQSHADDLFRRLENSLDAAIGRVIDDQMARVRSQMAEATPAAQLDAFLTGVNEPLYGAMIDAVDEVYTGHSGEIRRLNDYMEHLQRDADLTPSERLDRELLETWMLLVHEHGIAAPHGEGAG